MRAPGRCGTNSTACTVTRARATARAAERRRRNRKDHVLPNRTGWLPLLAAFVGVAGVTVLLVALLTNIFERKQEARHPFVRLAEVCEHNADQMCRGVDVAE